MLPKDPVIMLSVINTWLRDKYSSLDMLCEDNGLSCRYITDELDKIDYHYDAEKNQFV